ncbi:hypothetical protein DFH06DRAFT_1139270 [Mycena polygramma]|nr:hypothetical protein DFH06DRAFT_1139270 [Mycena polygramma]
MHFPCRIWITDEAEMVRYTVQPAQGATGFDIRFRRTLLQNEYQSWCGSLSPRRKWELRWNKIVVGVGNTTHQATLIVNGDRGCKRFGFDGRSTARREWNRLKRDELESLAERQEGKKKIRFLSPNSLTMRAGLHRSKMRVIRQLAAANLTNRSCNKPNERVAFTEVHTQFRATDVLRVNAMCSKWFVVKRGIYSNGLSPVYVLLCNFPSSSTMAVNIPEKPEAEHRGLPEVEHGPRVHGGYYKTSTYPSQWQVSGKQTRANDWSREKTKKPLKMQGLKSCPSRSIIFDGRDFNFKKEPYGERETVRAISCPRTKSEIAKIACNSLLVEHCQGLLPRPSDNAVVRAILAQMNVPLCLDVSCRALKPKGQWSSVHALGRTMHYMQLLQQPKFVVPGSSYSRLVLHARYYISRNTLEV